MVNHIVLFKLKDYPPEVKPGILNELKTALEGLKNKISELKHIEVGLNYQLDSKSYDFALITHFESIEGLDIYRTHPEHLKVAAKIQEATNARAAVDFMF